MEEAMKTAGLEEGSHSGNSRYESPERGVRLAGEAQEKLRG